MNQLTTHGIVLSRIDYGEADRIITLLTPEYGKLRLLARGVRRVKSKLAGGIELFSVSSLTFIRGRGELGTLVSARLEKHYGAIVKQIERVQLGYDLLKVLNKAIEDAPEAEYFDLLEQTLIALDDSSVDLRLIRFWFNTQLLKLAGNTPNLQTDAAGNKLVAEQTYTFDFDSVSFSDQPNGKFVADHIKFLRLSFAGNQPATLQQIRTMPDLLPTLTPLIQTMLTSYIRL